MSILIAALAGSFGAAARYVVSGAAQRRSRSSMPVGTAVVNLAGALALGVAVGSPNLSGNALLAVAGFMGGFTTFSTWMVETVRLGVAPALSQRAALNLIGMVVAGIALATLGYLVAS